ncbi:Chitinase 1 [Fusarium oxysporum f. sp. albedinis]|nr:Chitinase 1 [Fusarium oxysporum f. sp. albedinis]
MLQKAIIPSPDIQLRTASSRLSLFLICTLLPASTQGSRIPALEINSCPCKYKKIGIGMVNTAKTWYGLKKSQYHGITGIPSHTSKAKMG